MTQVNFSGKGTDGIDGIVGKGQGLKVGDTKINFANGKIQFNDSETIGNFRTLKSKGSDENIVKSFAFKSATKCIVKFQDTFIEYNLINEWLTLQGIQTEEISIYRTATGLTTDIFPFTFIASDNPDYKISIEKGTRDSDIETVFAPLSRAVDTYTQTVNTQGAKKIILTGRATAGTGTAVITGEIFDPASGQWIEHIPIEDIFTLQNGDIKRTQIGDTISRYARDEDIRVAWSRIGSQLQTSAIGEIGGIISGEVPHIAGAVVSNIGTVLPSGDSLFRIKVVVTDADLTFSIGVLKVFD